MISNGEIVHKLNTIRVRKTTVYLSVFRDLKPENVVFFEKLGMVKLTDFGFSNKFDPGERLMTSCGSLAYSAPEILLGSILAYILNTGGYIFCRLSPSLLKNVFIDL